MWPWSTPKKEGKASKRSKGKRNSARKTVDDDGTQTDSSKKKRSASAKRKKNSARKVVTKAQPAVVVADSGLALHVRSALRKFVEDACKTGVQGMLAEFEEIKRLTQGPAPVVKEAFDAHPEKNRYKDVFCVDQSRVVLRYPMNVQDDYIHANWVTTADGRNYICSQGPLPSTVDDFWRMVWQEKCKAIVMLCNVVECGKKKCEQYWPENVNQEQRNGSLLLRTLKKEPFDAMMTLTEIRITDGIDSHTLEHIQWINWPDRGVPKETLPCLRLINKLRSLSPAVIHCSAGIGRTGTIVGLDMAYTKLMQGDYAPLKQIVLELRDRRHGSVQMDVQYLYMHRVLIDIAIFQKVVTADEVKDFTTKYDELCRLRGF